MAAAAEEDVSTLSERVAELSVSRTENDEKDAAGRINGNDVDVTAKSCEPRLWGFETRELYKLALNFYKGERDTLTTLSRCGARSHLFRSIKSHYFVKKKSFTFLHVTI